MFTDFIITFRETLEAALVVGIVLSYLNQLDKKSWYKTVYWAVGLGIALSVVAGVLLDKYLGGFTGVVEAAYEGVIMLIAAGLITWMIVWMIKQKHMISQHLREKVDKHIQAEQKAGVFFLVLTAILREGIETVLFLKASSLQSGGNSIVASALGIIIAIVIGYMLFSGLKKISLKHFFSVTSVLLILFAAGLTAHGVHELQEAGWIPVVAEEIWDVNPEVVKEGVYPLLHEKGAVGGIFKGVFGWNGNPNLLEVISYFLYLLIVGGMVYRQSNKDPEIKG